MNTYVKGAKIALTCVFRVNGVLTDPTTVTLKVIAPETAQANYTYPASVNKDGTGQFSKVITGGTPGRWKYRWEGTGAAEQVAEGYFTVKTSPFV
jgi:hypothetical protein